MFYTNGSSITKTFHGVTFNPGETKEVFGIINDPCFVQSSTRKEPPKCDRSKQSELETKASTELKSRRRTKSSDITDKVEISVDTDVPSDSDTLLSVENKEV